LCWVKCCCLLKNKIKIKIKLYLTKLIFCQIYVAKGYSFVTP
jgi:hypothetical protein